MGPVIKLRFRDGNGNRGFEIIKKKHEKSCHINES